MMRRFAVRMLVACVACLAVLQGAGPAVAQPPPPYQIILRSRNAESTPQRNGKDAQTSGGQIEVVQRDPNSVLIVMRGAVVAGAETHKGGAASIQFVLNQDFEIVPTRANLKPPRVLLSGQLIGALSSSQPQGGEAQQGAACAAINSAGQPLANICIKPHAVGPAQNLFVNDKTGPCEMVVAPGGYCLHATFDLAATAPPIETWCPRVVPAAAAVFMPDPRLNPRWNYVLLPFAAVPAADFGFTILLRVVEDSPLPAAGIEPLPPPQRTETSVLHEATPE